MLNLYSRFFHFLRIIIFAHARLSRKKHSHNWRAVRETFEESMVIRALPRAFSLFIPSSASFCRVFRSDSRSALPFAATVPPFFPPFSSSRLLLYHRLRLRSPRGTLTRTLGRRVIRRGTCWRKQSPRVNTESDERVIVNWENRVRSLVISIASDCRYLLSGRYSRGHPICFRHPTFNFAKDNHRTLTYRALCKRRRVVASKLFRT